MSRSESAKQVLHENSISVGFLRQQPGILYPEQFQPRPGWVPVDDRHVLGKPPNERPRMDGVVGPEPDWHVIYSHVPLKEMTKLFPDLGGYGHFHQMFPRGGKLRSPPGMIHTSGMKYKHVLMWTAMAHAVGIQFSGKKGYKFPKMPMEGIQLRFENLNKITHKKRAKGPWVDPKSPLREKKHSSKQMRKSWYHTRHLTKQTFKEFASTWKKTHHVLGNTKLPIPRPTAEALVRIYTRRIEQTVKPVPKEAFKSRQAWKQAKQQAFASAEGSLRSLVGESLARYNALGVHRKTGPDYWIKEASQEAYTGMSRMTKYIGTSLVNRMMSTGSHFSMCKQIMERMKHHDDVRDMKLFNASNDGLQAHLSVILDDMSQHTVELTADFETGKILRKDRKSGNWFTIRNAYEANELCNRAKGSYWIRRT
jgi:hypothetical protein